MAESSQGDSLKEGKTSDVRRREQCVLMSLWKKLATYNYHTFKPGEGSEVRAGVAPTQAPPQFYGASGGGRKYKNFSILEGNPIDVLHSLVGNRDLHKVFSKIKPIHLSSLVPKIRIFKVYQDLNEDGEPNKRPPVDVELAFSDHSEMTKDAILYSMKSRGDDVGIKSFSLSFLGVNEAEVENNLECSLSLFFRSLSDMDAERPIPAKEAAKLRGFGIMKKRATAGNEEASQGSVSYKYTDLLIPPGAATSRTKVGLDGTMQHNPFSYRIKAEIGWAFPEGAETLIGQLPGGTGENGILEAIKSSTKSIMLTMTSHSFLFEDDGTIKLTINFIGAIESLLKSNRGDMLFASPRISKEIRAIDARIKGIKVLMGQNPSSETPGEAEVGFADENLSAGKLSGEADIVAVYDEADEKYLKDIKEKGSGEILKAKLKGLRNLRYQIYNIARNNLYSKLMKSLIDDGAVHTINVHTAMLQNPGRYMRENLKANMQGTIQPVYTVAPTPGQPMPPLTGPGQYFAGNVPFVNSDGVISDEYSKSPIEGAGISLKSLKDFITGDFDTTYDTEGYGRAVHRRGKLGLEFTKFSDYGGIEKLSHEEIRTLVEKSFNLEGGPNAAQPGAGRAIHAGLDEYKRLDGGLKQKQEYADDETSDIDKINAFRDLLTPRRFNATTSKATRRLHGANESRGQVFINFIFLGDIIDAILGSVNSSVLDQVELILGPIMFRDMTSTFGEDDPQKQSYGKISIVSLADVPISLNLFMEWILKEIVAPQHEVLPFLSLLRNSITKLLFESLSVSCSPVKFEHARLSTAFPTLSALHMGNDVYEPVIKRKSRSNINNIRGLITTAQKTINKASKKTTQYMYLYADTTQPHFLSGRIDKDEKLGIHHFFIGADSGLVKSIKFSKIDQPEYRALRITQANQNSNHFEDILKEPYNATVILVGNMLFYPGMRIYINPTLVGGGSPRKDGASLARRLGLGGYYIITKVECEVSANDFETILQCHFETFGEVETGGTNDGRGAPTSAWPVLGLDSPLNDQIDKVNRAIKDAGDDLGSIEDLTPRPM